MTIAHAVLVLIVGVTVFDVVAFVIFWRIDRRRDHEWEQVVQDLDRVFGPRVDGD